MCGSSSPRANVEVGEPSCDDAEVEALIVPGHARERREPELPLSSAPLPEIDERAEPCGRTPRGVVEDAVDLRRGARARHVSRRASDSGIAVLPWIEPSPRRRG